MGVGVFLGEIKLPKALDLIPCDYAYKVTKLIYKSWLVSGLHALLIHH